MAHERFVLSAHGSAMSTAGFVFDIPDNITLYTYGELNTCAKYDNADPNKVCSPNPPAPFNKFDGGGGRRFPNFRLWSDESDESQTFYSGVKRCSDNSVVINIDEMPIRCGTTRWCRYQISLSEIVDIISREMRKLSGSAEIHLLICLGQVDPGVMETMKQQAAAALSRSQTLTAQFGRLSISPGGGGGSRRHRKSIRGRRDRQRKNRSKSKSKSKSNRRRKPRR